MFHNALPVISDLFGSDSSSSSRRVKFSWRLVRRRKRPFLLLPDTPGDARVSLGIYSPQRMLALLWCSAIPLLFKTPARNLFGIVEAEADGASELLNFFAQQSGLPVEQLRSPAIKFGGVADRTSRLVLLLCDATGHPIRVIKMGLNPEGRAATEREAELLAHLPKNVIGCTSMTGQIKTDNWSAFATAYFPGESLGNDLGIEKLFHTWLIPGPALAVENLANWQELESAVAKIETRIWPVLAAALAGQRIQTTLYHGDFTPWNVRMTNLENIQAFDWERGHLRGIPAWDWFHFIIQTAVLVKRHSPERVAAELDQLIRSPRFQTYAQAAGITGVVEPLLLAYLLHERYVVKPCDGGAITGELFELLWAEWQLGKNMTAVAIPAAGKNDVKFQVKSAFKNLTNLFWEPSLSPHARLTFNALLDQHWQALLLSLGWILGVVSLPLMINSHLMFTPFYLAPCIYLALKTDRRLATIVAQTGAIGAPLIFYYARPDFEPFQIICWNIVMRMIVFQLVVSLFDRISQQSILRRRQIFSSAEAPIAALAGSWPVIGLAVAFFSLVVLLDVWTSPHMVLLPLYMLPCIILTLALNWRWGTLAAILAAIIGPLLQRPDKGYQPLGIEFWNMAMRFILYELVVVLLERVRRENILYSHDGVKSSGRKRGPAVPAVPARPS